MSCGWDRFLRSEVNMCELGIGAVIEISDSPFSPGDSGVTLGHSGVAAVAFWFLETG